MTALLRQLRAIASGPLSKHPARYTTVFAHIAGTVEQVTIQRLAAMTGIERQAIYRAVQVLERSGLVEWMGMNIIPTATGLMLYADIEDA